MERGFPSDGKTERNKKKEPEKNTRGRKRIPHKKKKRQMVP
jgi:hypothetical protein